MAERKSADRRAARMSRSGSDNVRLPLYSHCMRRHRLIRNSCFYIIDYMRLISVFAFVMSVSYIEEAHHFSDVRLVGILLGIIFMFPSSFYERLVT